MKIKNKIKKITLYLLFIQCLLFLGQNSRASAIEHVSADFSTVINDNFLGINAVYHAFTYLPESIEQGMNEDLRKIEMQRVKDSGISIARTFYRPDWAMGQGAWAEPDWQSVKMQALYSWLADMQKLNIDVALNMGWWFVRDIIWNRDQHLARYPDDLNHYKKWVSDSLYQIIEKRGFDNVKYICMFTEPANVFGDIPNEKKPWSYYRQVLQAVDAQLQADGRRDLVQMVGPNSTQAPRWLDKAARELNDVIDIYSSHNYNFTTYKRWSDMALAIQQAVADTGKPFWIDEYGVQDFNLRKSVDYGTVLALANVAFINAGAQTSLLWILNDQYYPYPIKYITNGDAFTDGLHKWGLYPWLVENKLPRPAWYAFSLMSRLMAGGGRTYSTSGSDGLRLAATGEAGVSNTVMVVNEQKKVIAMSLNLSGAVARKMYRYIYNDNNERLELGCQQIDVTDKNNNTVILHDKIPPRAVIFYSTIDLGCDGALFVNRPKVVQGDTANLALGAKVTASSQHPAYPAENIVDGSRLYGWQSKALVDNSPISVTVDLGGLCQVAKLAVYPARDADGFPAGYRIELSADGYNWLTVLNWKGVLVDGSAVLIHEFPAEIARFMRLEMMRSAAGGDAVVLKIAELKIYAAQAP